MWCSGAGDWSHSGAQGAPMPFLCPSGHGPAVLLERIRYVYKQAALVSGKAILNSNFQNNMYLGTFRWVFFFFIKTARFSQFPARPLGTLSKKCPLPILMDILVIARTWPGVALSPSQGYPQLPLLPLAMTSSSNALNC